MESRSTLVGCGLHVGTDDFACESGQLATGCDIDSLPGTQRSRDVAACGASARGESAALHGCRRGNQVAVSLSLPARREELGCPRARS